MSINRISLLGVPVDICSPENLENEILELLANPGTKQIIFLSIWNLLRARHKGDYGDAIKNADLIIPVSKSILKGAKFLKLDVPVRYNPFNAVIQILGILDSHYKSLYLFGSTKKTLYVSLEDDSAGNPVFVKRKATLRACNETCNVWVLDDYYDETSAGTKVNTDFAKKIAEKFKSLYPLVRNVYGNESDKIYYPVVRGNTIYFELVEMDYLSDTGTKVNIVIYDLYGDADQGKVLGFFAPRDYYPNDDDLHKLVNTSDNLNSYSNEGKYFLY